jgi:hypothetical protein
MTRDQRNAVRVHDADFGGVELHGAHGYLFGQFLSAMNTRSDGWGGPLAGRARLVRETMQAIRAAVPAGFVVGVRLWRVGHCPGSRRHCEPGLAIKARRPELGSAPSTAHGRRASRTRAQREVRGVHARVDGVRCLIVGSSRHGFRGIQMVAVVPTPAADSKRSRPPWSLDDRPRERHSATGRSRERGRERHPVDIG